VSCDLEYAENQSLLMDLKIMVRTLPAVISMRGAG
jgi:lipopolysaccharide/colanic/teichoic acid biosynthesis glycosyltransferase